MYFKFSNQNFIGCWPMSQNFEVFNSVFTIACFWCNSLKTQLLRAVSFMPLFLLRLSTNLFYFLYFREQKNLELTNKIVSLWIQDWTVGNFSEWFETWKLLKNVSWSARALGLFVTLFRTWHCSCVLVVMEIYWERERELLHISTIKRVLCKAHVAPNMLLQWFSPHTFWWWGQGSSLVAHRLSV